MLKKIQKLLKKEGKTSKWRNIISTEIRDASPVTGKAECQGPVEIGRVAISIKQEILPGSHKNETGELLPNDVVIHYDCNISEEGNLLMKNDSHNVTPPRRSDSDVFDDTESAVFWEECSRPHVSPNPSHLIELASHSHSQTSISSFEAPRLASYNGIALPAEFSVVDFDEQNTLSPNIKDTFLCENASKMHLSTPRTDPTGNVLKYFHNQSTSLCQTEDECYFDVQSASQDGELLLSSYSQNVNANKQPASSLVLLKNEPAEESLPCLSTCNTCAVKDTSSNETATVNPFVKSGMHLKTKDVDQEIHMTTYTSNAVHKQTHLDEKNISKYGDQVVSMEVDCNAPSKELRIFHDAKYFSVGEYVDSLDFQLNDSYEILAVPALRRPTYVNEIESPKELNLRQHENIAIHFHPELNCCSKTLIRYADGIHSSLPTGLLDRKSCKALGNTKYPFPIVKKNTIPTAKVKPWMRSNKNNYSLEEGPVQKVSDTLHSRSLSNEITWLYHLLEVFSEYNFVSYSQRLFASSRLPLLFLNTENYAEGAAAILSVPSMELNIASENHLSHPLMQNLIMNVDTNSLYISKQIQERSCFQGRKNSDAKCDKDCDMSNETAFEKQLFKVYKVPETSQVCSMSDVSYSPSVVQSNIGVLSVSPFAKLEVISSSLGTHIEAAMEESLGRSLLSLWNRDIICQLSNDESNAPLFNKEDNMMECSNEVSSKKQLHIVKKITTDGEHNKLTAVSNSLDNESDDVEVLVEHKMTNADDVIANGNIKGKPHEISFTPHKKNDTCSVFRDDSIPHDDMGNGMKPEMCLKINSAVDIPRQTLTIVSFNPTCLYNHVGEICTLKNNRYIKTNLPKCGKLVYVNIKRKEMFGSKIGCQVVWDGQTPVPLFDVEDGNEVQFDAINVAESDSFQALVIWKNVKPNYVTEPSNRSYTLICNKRAVFRKLFIRDNKKYAQVYLEGNKILAGILKGGTFVNGKKSDLATLLASSDTVFCTVSLLMSGRLGGYYIYVCSCIWSGSKPLESEIPTSFKMGEIYRLSCEDEFVADPNPLCLYCDQNSYLRRTSLDTTIQFKLENNTVSVPVHNEDLHYGNYKVRFTQDTLPVKAHVLRVAESRWHVLLLQLCENYLPVETFRALKEQEHERSDVEKDISCDLQQQEDHMQQCEGVCEIIAGNNGVTPSAVAGETDIPASTMPEEAHKNCRQKAENNIHNFLQTLVTGSEIKTSLEPDVDLKYGKEVKSDISTQIETKECKRIDDKHSTTVKKQNAHSANPKFLHDATGYLTKVIGDYGVLRIRNKQLKCQVLAMFHKNVTYINRWPLYKDVLFSEQLESLSSNVWHCSLKKNRGTIGGMIVDYEVSLAWQGFKPTISDIHYFKNLPCDDSFWYSNSYRMNGELGTHVFYNDIYGDIPPQEDQCTQEQDVGNDLADYANLFPTMTSECDVEIVDAPAVTSLYAKAFQPRAEFDFGLRGLFETSSIASSDTISLISPLDLFSADFLQQLPLV